MPGMEYGKKIPGGWFDEVRHLYRNESGLIVPSATQVFDILGCNSLDAVPEDVLVWKQNYGIAVHAAVQYMVQGDLDWDSLDDAIVPAVTGVEQYLKRHGYRYESAEESMISTIYGMQYGMTLDGRGWIQYRGVERRVVLDLKTSAKKSPTWGWQLGGYSIPLPKVEKGWIGMVLQIGKDGSVEPHYYDLYEEARKFQTLLAAAIVKINAGMGKIR